MAEDTDTFQEWASQPFSPGHLLGNGNAADVGGRVVCALEYIAAQLGEISRKLDNVGSGFSGSREDFDDMNELLKKL